jgi:8-oxo-dGTP diphosphatase
MASRRADRAAVLVRRGDRILLLHRGKSGEVYDALPGGKIEPGETPAEAAVREVREETGLEVTVSGPVLVLANEGRQEVYFDAEAPDGDAVLGGPEAERNSPENSYALEWVPVASLSGRPLRPAPLKRWLVERFASAEG